MSATLAEIVKALRSVYRAEGTDIWLTAQNPLLDNQRPWDLIVAGEGDRVLAIIEGMADGVIF